MFGGPGTTFTGTSNTPASTFNVGEAFGLQGPSAAMANMAVQSLIPQFFGNKGDVFGQFSPKIGFGEQLRRQNAYAMQQEVVASASKLDEATYQKMLEGAANLAGTPFGEREKKGAATMSKDLSAFMASAAQINPDFVDQMHGTRGSAAVMANRMASASRYMQDPTTGAIGLSKENLSNLVNTFNESMFGPNADLSKMRGISAGQAGGMFDQMTRRGLMGSSMPDLEQVAKEQGKTIDELSKLPDFSAKVQQFQANRTADKLKAMTGAVSAMKDVFGENGQANAPIEQIFNALQQVTQNKLGTMSGSEIEKTVRDMNNAAKMGGIDFKGMMQVNAMASQATDRLGLDRSFAPRIATGAMTYSAAYGSQTGNMRVFGMFDKEKMLQVAANMQAAATGSTEANEAAAILRLDRAGALDLAKSPELADYLQKIKSGERIEPIASAKLKDMVSKAGVTEGQFTAFAAQREQNQALISEKDLGRVVGQQASIKQAKAMVGRGLMSGLTQSGLETDPNAGKAFIASVVEDISSFDSEQREEFSKGNFKPFVDKVRANYKTATGKEMSEKQANFFLEYGSGQVTRMAASLGYGNIGNMANIISKDVRQDQDMREQQIQATSEFDKSLSKFGRGTPMQRFVDSIMKGKPDQTVGDFVRDVFGAVPQDQLKAAMTQGLEKDVQDFQAINKRDTIKDTATLLTTSSAGKLNNLTKEQQTELDVIKKTYGLSDDDLKNMKGLDQKGIIRKLNYKGNLSKAAVLDKINKTFVDTGMSKIEPPQVPQQGAQPGTPLATTKTGTGFLDNAINNAKAFVNSLFPAGAAPVTPPGTTPATVTPLATTPGATPGTGTPLTTTPGTPLPGTPLTTAKTGSGFFSNIISSVKDVVNSLVTPGTPPAGTTPGTPPAGTTPGTTPGTPLPGTPLTTTKTGSGFLDNAINNAKAALSSLLPAQPGTPASSAPGASAPTSAKPSNFGDLFKSFDLSKISPEAIKQYATSGGLVNMLSKAEKQKQEAAEKSGAKIQTVRLEGGTELTGRLNIVSEEIMMQIPQTQKI